MSREDVDLNNDYFLEYFIDELRKELVNEYSMEPSERCVDNIMHLLGCVRKHGYAGMSWFTKKED